MKRHPGLRDLSSDHHQGLVQARRLVKAAAGATSPTGDGADSPGSRPALQQVARDFLAFWGEHTTRHFREEEEVLLPAYARYGDATIEPVVRVLVEHVRIRRLVDDLRQQVERGEPSAETVAAIGDLLRAHIRHEEDVLFPLIEEAMPEAALQALSGQLSAFSEQHGV